MKWFKKLFTAISPSEAPIALPCSLHLPVEPAAEALDTPLVFVPPTASVESLLAATQPRTPPEEEIVALTTIGNFHYDLLVEQVLECEWVVIKREELERPRFLEGMARRQLTSRCKRMADETRRVRPRSHHQHACPINWTPPNYDCDSYCRAPKKPPLWQRMWKTIKNAWSKFCKKLRRQCEVIEEELFKVDVLEQGLFEVEDSAGRVRALRGCRGSRGAGAALRAYALHLAQDKSTTFAQNVDHFIACTLDSKEICPQVVMRNMRQFMSGMKNYLVKHGEREFEKEVEKERMKLKSTEFLNLDAILETVMHRLVVRPLRARLYTLLANWHASDVHALHSAIEHAAPATPLQMGIKASTNIPSPAVMATISKHFLKMQEADSPLDKLENLLAAISAIFNSIRGERALGADDLLPMLAWVVSRCRLVCAELEAELMAGLLPPALLAGEGGYYLTALFSAVAVLKKLAPDQPQDPATLWRRSSLESSSGGGQACVVRVALPDECRGSIRRVALPCRPGARARDLCRALAHQAAITNPQDYALFALHNGQETMLSENDCPQDVMSEKNEKNCILAYKRIDAKIAWPQQALLSLP